MDWNRERTIHMKIHFLMNRAIFRTFSLIALLWIPLSILAEDARPFFYFRKDAPSSFDTRDGVLAGIKTEFPKAVKVFEFYDEGGNFILLKLSDHSYATQSFSGMHVAEFVYDAKDSQVIPVKAERKVTGRFTYQSVNLKNNGEPTTITWNWTLFEKELDLKDAKKLLFRYQFSRDEKNGLPAKKLTIAVDWEAGRAEGVKIEPITRNENEQER